MAIQNRRGVYSDFTPSKMVPGELAVVQSGDPNNTSGKAVYAAFGASGDVKRLASEDDLSGKVDKVTGKGLSTNDYTTAEKNKLSGIEAQANKTVIDSTLTQTGQAADAKAVGDAIDSVTIETDKTLTEEDVPADAKVVGDELDAVKSDLESLEPGLSDDAKEALLACFAHVAWIGTDGQDYYDALSESLNVTVWDYEWKASASSGLPDGMTADSYQYDSSLSALQIYNGILNFEYLGDCILEVEANAPTSEYTKNDSPSFACGFAYVGGEKIREAGLWCNKAGGTDNNVWGTIDSDNHAIVDTHIDGTQFHKYRIEVQDGVGSIYVDNSLIGSGDRDSRWAGSARVSAGANLINLRSVKLKMMTDWYEQDVRVFLNVNCNATKLVGTTDLDSSALTGDYITYEGETSAAANRRTLVVKKGIVPFTTRSNQQASEYPIPVPKNANKIKVTVTPNTQYSFITLLKLNRTTNKYSSPQSIGGWAQGENVKTFTASEDLFVAINFKYNSSGNTYPTEPTSIVVEFSEV